MVVPVFAPLIREEEIPEVVPDDSKSSMDVVGKREFQIHPMSEIKEIVAIKSSQK